MNFRHWEISNKKEEKFNLLELPNILRPGRSLPDEGTRVLSQDDQEIFHHDLIQMEGSTYWVRYQHGAYAMELIEAADQDANSCWLHDAVTQKKNLKIIGNSHSDSALITQYWRHARS